MEFNFMRKYCIVPLYAILLGSVSGCSSISEEECLLGDWYQVGLSDGQKGKNSHAAEYNKDCSEYQVQVDVKLYSEGRSEGLKSFCTYENGVSLSKSNQSYNNVCPAELSLEFLSGYTPYHNLASAQSEQRSYESNINHYVALLDGHSLSDSDRKTYEANLKSARYKLDQAEYKVSKYENELALHKIQVEKNKIVEELSNNDLPSSRKDQLNKRLNTLDKQQSFYENLSQTENTIRSIKGIADLF